MFWKKKKNEASDEAPTKPPAELPEEDDDEIDDDEGEDDEEWDDEEEDDPDERDLDEQGKRVAAILGTEDLEVTAKALKTYRKYLIKNIEMPCRLTGSEDFPWEERFFWGAGDKREHEELKETNPSSEDDYDLLTLPDLDVDYGIYAKLRRVSDRKQFELPLVDLKAVDEKSKNHQLLDDYSCWFVNWR